MNASTLFFKDSTLKEILSFESFYKNKPGLEIRLNHERKRVLRKIKKKVIFAENPESLSALLNIKYNDLTVYNSLPEKKLEIKNTDIILFAGKVLLISYLNKKEPSSILINDSGFYKIQVDLFNSMWQNGTNRTLYYTEKK